MESPVPADRAQHSRGTGQTFYSGQGDSGSSIAGYENGVLLYAKSLSSSESGRSRSLLATMAT